MRSRDMIGTHPDVQDSLSERLARCIDECFACAQACVVCADACLAEESVEHLRQCIRLDLDCADICLAAGKLASRRTGGNELVLRQMLELCAAACRTCAEECERHAGAHEHCRICADACRGCQRACEDAIRDVGP